MTILIEKVYFYDHCKGAITIDYSQNDIYTEHHLDCYLFWD